MSEKNSSGASVLLVRLLEADRAARQAREAFEQISDKQARYLAIAAEVDRAMATTDDADDDGEERLIYMADLLIDLAGPEAAQLLLRILGHQEPAVRLAAGEALVELLYERYGEIARVIEKEIDQGAEPAALAEIPFLLAEVGEAGGTKIITKLLSRQEPEVVGAAIEGLAAMDDPSVIRALEPLRNDKRRVSVDDENNEAGEITLGELAVEAIEHLRKAHRA